MCSLSQKINPEHSSYIERCDLEFRSAVAWEPYDINNDIAGITCAEVAQMHAEKMSSVYTNNW